MAKLFIEASNIGSGGGITHLRELIRYAAPENFGFEKVELWGPEKLLNQIPDKKWLLKKTHPWINAGFLKKLLWQKLLLPKMVKKEPCVLYLPAGNDVDHHPKISFCQNLQPFDPKTQKEYGISLTRLRLMILGHTQAKCYRSCDGMVYLTEFSMRESFKYSGDLSEKSVIIPHAVEVEKFFKGSLQQREKPSPLKILYVSTIVFYKRQDVLVKAVGELIEEGFEVELTLIGGAYPKTMSEILSLKQSYNLNDHQLRIITQTSHDELPKFYQEADLFVMASSNETFGITLLEAMATGIPVLCANNPSLVETLGNEGAYYETFNHKDLKQKIKNLASDPILRKRLATKGFERAKNYHWKRTADETLAFLSRHIVKL